ncbi:hypothetical protein LCGC14_2709470 [marine sediment metagenome]|uniref:Uncharacterized protein n=1 Tax=marine sediment metagenome TaxID=412755 RepID=A0A0F8ZDD9_9ZZZZ
MSRMDMLLLAKWTISKIDILYTYKWLSILKMNPNEIISYVQSITPTQLFSAYSLTWDEADETDEIKSFQKGFLQSLNRTELQRAWIGYQQNGEMFPLNLLRNFFFTNYLPVKSTETSPQDRER